MAKAQDAAWGPADNGSYDRVIDPRDLRSELVRVLERCASRAH
jgi:acetyl-CoA carboxylase carboxyltransferase component